MSSSSGDCVTLSVRPFVRPKCFFDFEFTSLLGQDLWHLWSLKWPRTTVKVSHAMPKQMCWSLKLKYEIWIRPLQLKFDIECFAFGPVDLDIESEDNNGSVICVSGFNKGYLLLTWKKRICVRIRKNEFDKIAVTINRDFIHQCYLNITTSYFEWE